MHQKLQKIFSIAIFIFMTHAYAELHRTYYPPVSYADSQPEISNNDAPLARVLAFGKGTSLWQGYY